LLKSKLFYLLGNLIYYNSIILCLIFSWIILISNLLVRLLNYWVLFISKQCWIYIANLWLTLNIFLNFKSIIFWSLVLRFLLALINNHILKWLHWIIVCLYLNKHILSCKFLSFSSCNKPFFRLILLVIIMYISILMVLIILVKGLKILYWSQPLVLCCYHVFIVCLQTLLRVLHNILFRNNFLLYDIPLLL
jgi:hypothetical protein